MVSSANCLQPDGQNDNGWDQGLLFLNPSKVWLQPPGYVARMIARHAQAKVIDAEVGGGDASSLDVTATRSEDGRTVVLQVVNLGGEPTASHIRLEGFAPTRATAELEELAGPTDAANTAEEPERIQSRRVEWKHEMKDGTAGYTFPSHSFTVIRFE